MINSPILTLVRLSSIREFWLLDLFGLVCCVSLGHDGLVVVVVVVEVSGDGDDGFGGGGEWWWKYQVVVREGRRR